MDPGKSHCDKNPLLSETTMGAGAIKLPGERAPKFLTAGTWGQVLGAF